MTARQGWQRLFLLGIRYTPLPGQAKNWLLWLFGPKVLLAAKAVITDSQGRLLLVQSLWSGRWELPGGIVNRTEEPEHAVRRECREELGLDVTDAQLVAVAKNLRGLGVTIYFRCQLAAGPLGLSVEHTGYRFVEPSALPTQIRALLNLPGPAAARNQ